MGLGQFIFLGIATLVIILTSVLLRKASHKRIDVLLKVLAVLIPFLDILKITVESYFDITGGDGFNFSGLIPLYTCSIFVYLLPIAAFGRGKAREYSLSFITTIGIFAGLTNFVMAPILNTYPFLNFHTFVSLHLHFWMVFTGIFLIATGYYVPKWADIFKSMIPLTAMSLVAIPVDYALSAYYGWSVDYMLYYSGNGAPILPQLSGALAELGLRPVFTLIIFIMYIIISAIIVSIIRLVCHLRNLKKEKM
jgi:hypothetical protein